MRLNRFMVLFSIPFLSGFFAPTSSNGADPGLPRVFFSPATNLAAGSVPVSVAVGDFNGDGKQDLAVANFIGTNVIFLGNGNGTFQAPKNFAAGTNPSAVAVG